MSTPHYDTKSNYISYISVFLLSSPTVIVSTLVIIIMTGILSARFWDPSRSQSTEANRMR